jgi:membrane protein DedA with SNARE-associated domain
MEWWREVGAAFQIFLDQYGLVAAFAVLLIEEAGVPVPIPGDFLMLLLGVQARQGLVNFWVAVAAMELATVMGAAFLYYLARVAGRTAVYRYGRFVRLTPERLDRAEKWIAGKGFTAVFLGRLVPGLRIVTAVACGVFRVPARVFMPAMALGALFYILVYTALGYFVGPSVLSLLEHVHLPLNLLWSLVPLALLVWWIAQARRGLRAADESDWIIEPQHHPRIGATAGLLATLGSTALVNVLVNIGSSFAWQAPGDLVHQTADRVASWLIRDAQPWPILIAIPAYLSVGVAWGAVYGWRGADRIPLPDLWRGVAFSFIPLVISVGVVFPLIGIGVIGTGAVGPVALASEAVRHVAYGAILGLTYPVLLARRRRQRAQETKPIDVVRPPATTP